MCKCFLTPLVPGDSNVLGLSIIVLVAEILGKVPKSNFQNDDGKNEKMVVPDPFICKRYNFCSDKIIIPQG